MTRELSKDEQAQQDEPILDDAAEAAPAPRAKGLFIGSLKLQKWDGDGSKLPPASYGKPKGGKPGKYLAPGEPRHFLAQAGHRRYKLLAARRSRGGVQTRLVAVLRDSKKFPAQQSMIAKLKKEGYLVG